MSEPTPASASPAANCTQANWPLTPEMLADAIAVIRKAAKSHPNRKVRKEAQKTLAEYESRHGQETEK